LELLLCRLDSVVDGVIPLVLLDQPIARRLARPIF
jgi:hypothetical protein